MGKKKITVATVCYNAEHCIEESILSVINQTYDNIEYIIIDGNSSDGTRCILEKYKKYISKIVSEKDEGIYDAMNKALNLSTGDYLIFLGADDHFISFKTLERIIDKLCDSNKVYYGNVYMEGTNKIYKGKFSKYTRAYFNYCHQGVFYPKLAYKKYFYDLKYKVASDNDYNLRLTKEFNFEYLNDTISFFSTSGTSAMKSLKDIDYNWYKDKSNKIRTYLGFFPWLYFCFRNLLYKFNII